MSKCLAFFLSIFLISISCTAQAPVSQMVFSGGKKIVFLNAEAAAEAIVEDNTDKFFERVTIAEMSIQMKKTFGQDWTRQMIVEDYKAYLKDDVVDFSAAELSYMEEVMDEVYATCATVSPALLPDELKIIKTSAKHYGKSVYYTRENCIIIPYNELAPSNREHFTHTMFHELFHVTSRQNPMLREKLYSLIGFQHIGYENLRLPSPLAARVLLNPDGADFAQVINLTTLEGSSIYAIPVIYASQPAYTPTIPQFFGYLSFELFQVIQNQDGSWAVVTGKNGYSSTLDLKALPDFFKQIKDNTHYIIHPDEILADNFTFLMESKLHPTSIKKYNEEGQALIQQIEAVIKSPESVFVKPLNSKNTNNK